MLAPLIASFTKTYPHVTLELILSDDFKDMIDEGFDAAFRVSQMPDSGFISRRLGKVRRLTVASHAYLEGAGTPVYPKELKEHQCLHMLYHLNATGNAALKAVVEHFVASLQS